MAKKALDFGKLVLPQKTTIIKKTESVEPTIELAIEKIHGEVSEPLILIPRSLEQEQYGKADRVAEAVSAVVVEQASVAPPKKEKSNTKSNMKSSAKSTKKALMSQTFVPEIPDDEAMPVKKISMDLPLDVYKYLKINAFDRATTMKDYVLRLIEADMAKRK
jgi:hypothetical protein